LLAGDERGQGKDGERGGQAEVKSERGVQLLANLSDRRRRNYTAGGDLAERQGREERRFRPVVWALWKNPACLNKRGGKKKSRERTGKRGTTEYPQSYQKLRTIVKDREKGR